MTAISPIVTLSLTWIQRLTNKAVKDWEGGGEEGRRTLIFCLAMVNLAYQLMPAAKSIQAMNSQAVTLVTNDV